jgi:hypothetical protein
MSYHFTRVHIGEGGEDMHGKPSFSRSSNRSLEYRGASPVHAIKELDTLPEPDQPISAVRARPHHKVATLQGVKSFINVSGGQIRDVGSMKKDVLSALPESFKKCRLHSLTKISGALLGED